jgi:hypothetical protein
VFVREQTPLPGLLQHGWEEGFGNIPIEPPLAVLAELCRADPILDLRDLLRDGRDNTFMGVVHPNGEAGQVLDSLAGYRRSQVEKASSPIRWFFVLNRKLGFCYNKTDSRHVGS